MPNGVFIANGPGRRFFKVEKIDGREEAFEQFGLLNLLPEPLFQNFIGNHFKDGAFTHLHSDPSPVGQVHVRVNWMLKKPRIGGDPVIDGRVIPVNEGDLWICFASEERHGSTPISGGERLICSFGALVPRNEAARGQRVVSSYAGF
jgi:hypothetical protein